MRITVLRGGPSAERKVSLDSGRAVADALKSRGHDVFVADIGPDQLDALDHPADVVFPALHGTFGEDGTVQRLLEQRRIPFVGAGSRASAIAMDKVAAKKLVAQEGIATPAFEVWNNKTLQARDAPEIPLPVVVKPVNQGSSVATRIVREPGALRPAVQVAVEQFEQALVEQFIAGDELTVGIVGTEALPPICVRPKRTFYDYRAKYQDAATEYLFDAGHPVSLLDRATAWSRRAFERIRCRHLARVDWMADRDGGLWFLEINTIPGFTSHSLVPKAAQRLGISFEDLVERLVFLAVEETP
ncbi:MAG: D-alanine--D-alanine ligase [Phycisphaerae bacterium]|nr:D-alanine--D-alanine ligase [Phycisphaerae bacterium]